MDWYRLCNICDPPRRHPVGEAHRFRDREEQDEAVYAPGASNRRSARRPVPISAQSVVGSEAAPNITQEDAGAQEGGKARGSGALCAPPGQCEFCDARRAYAARAMKQKRSRSR